MVPRWCSSASVVGRLGSSHTDERAESEKKSSADLHVIGRCSNRITLPLPFVGHGDTDFLDFAAVQG